MNEKKKNRDEGERGGWKMEEAKKEEESEEKRMEIGKMRRKEGWKNGDSWERKKVRESKNEVCEDKVKRRDGEEQKDKRKKRISGKGSKEGVRGEAGRMR